MNFGGEKFKHYNDYFEEFNYAPDQFVLFESHNVDFLKELLNDEKLHISINDRKRIVHYLSESTSQNPVPFKYYKKWKCGKYWPKLSFQHMEKSLKTKIYEHGGYVSLDIVNRGYTLIHEIAKVNGIALPQIHHLTSRREEVYQEHEHFWYNPKCGFLHLICYPVYLENQTPYIKKLIDEINYISKVFKHPKYPYYSLGHIIEIYSTKIMFIIADYLTYNGIINDNCYSLNGDEICFQALKPFNVKDIEEHIYFKTKFKIKLH